MEEETQEPISDTEALPDDTPGTETFPEAWVEEASNPSTQESDGDDGEKLWTISFTWKTQALTFTRPLDRESVLEKYREMIDPANGECTLIYETDEELFLIFYKDIESLRMVRYKP